MPTVVLMDVENTLVKEIKDVSQYLFEAIRSVYGISVDGIRVDDYVDMTIQGMLFKVLASAGLEEQDITQKMPQFFEELPYSHYNVAGHDSVSIAPGTKEMLESLAKDSDVVMGVATGQLEGITREMLTRADIDTDMYFKFGTYANAGRGFSEIIGAAASHALKKYGAEKRHMHIISCRPSMLSSALSEGLHAIGVAGMVFDSKALHKAGVQNVITNLRDVKKLIA